VKSPGDYVYVASVISSVLGRISESGLEAQIPKNVGLAAIDFFDKAISATGEQTPENPVASISNYALATAILAEMCLPAAGTRLQVEERLHAYKELLDKLTSQNREPLTLSEIQTSHEIQLFFRVMRRKGYDENYTKAMGHFSIE